MEIDGKLLKKYRVKAGLSQAELGSKVGLTDGMISKQERGRASIAAPHWSAVAAAVGEPLTNLLKTDTGDVFLPVGEIPLLDADALANVRAERVASLVDAWDGQRIMVPRTRGTSFALKVPDGAVNRICPQGSIVTICMDGWVLKDGYIYLLKYNRHVELRVYRDKSGPARFEPASSEPGFETCFDLNHVEVIGAAEKALVDLGPVTAET